jgi:hypothetical protein
MDTPVRIISYFYSEKLAKKIPLLLWNQKLITVFTRSRHRSLPWATWIQSTSSLSYFLKIRFSIILPSTPMFSKWSLPFRSNIGFAHTVDVQSKASVLTMWALGSWVRILLKAWVFVLVFLCCTVLCRLEALRQADHSSTESYQMSRQIHNSEIFLN